MSVKWVQSPVEPRFFTSEEGHTLCKDIGKGRLLRWFLIHFDGRRVELPKNATFDHAEAALAKLENAQ